MNRTITKIYKFVLNDFELVVIFLLVIMILKSFFCPLEKRIPSNDTILFPKDSLNISASERENRLQVLLNSIHLHQGFVVQQAVASESLKMQGRLLFITLFSGLITALYSVRDKEKRRAITSAALLVGLFWYGINVHKLDIENRGLPAVDMTFNTEIKLLNIPRDDNRLYYLDFIKLQNAIVEGDKDHKIRKINRFITPDISDIVFNMTPLLIFVFIYRLRKHSNDAT